MRCTGATLTLLRRTFPFNIVSVVNIYEHILTQVKGNDISINYGLAKNSVNKFQTIVLQQTDCINFKIKRYSL